MTGGRPDTTRPETIVALSSGTLPAAIAVVRTSGPDAFAAAAALAGPLPDERRASLRRLKSPQHGTTIDDALVIAFPGPNTATGEDIVEYQCHGSKAVVAALIDALVAQPGIRRAEPGEFTRRALSNSRIDLTQAEGLAELVEAESEAQRKSAFLRADGAIRRLIEQWRDSVLTLSAEAEVAIDYADEDDGQISYNPSTRATELASSMRQLLACPRVERLRDGVRIVVAGPPNAGKSSLVNALAGEQRAIVTAIPGTTRDLIEVPLIIDGLPIVLVDTAGLRTSQDEVEAIGIGLAQREIERADILMWLGESAECPAHPLSLQVATKSDLRTGSAGLPTSTVTGEGLSLLQAKLAELAVQIIPTGDQPALTRREAALVTECAEALEAVAMLDDPLLAAERLRGARIALDQISGLAGVEQLLDALFGRFCLGK